MSKNLKFTPLGGLGQIGSNMTLIKSPDSSIVIDAGILFPNDDFFDINYLIPDLSEVGHVDKLIITHAHEDHIGAIFHALEILKPEEVWSPRLAHELIQVKLGFQSHKSYYRPKFHVYNENTTILCSDVRVDPVHVNHSIPQTFGLHFEWNNNSLFFVSDFKIDLDAVYEPGFNFEKLKTLSSKCAKRFLFADSTNITSKNTSTPGEGSLIEPLENIIKNAGDRVFITSFSSNLHRMQTVIDICARQKKKLVFHGRSAINYSKLGLSLGIISDPGSVIRDVDSIKPLSHDLVVWASGSQGEFKGTMRRILMREDKTFKPSEFDTFVFSSKAIPGNEKNIASLFNMVGELNAALFTSGNANIHVSGHPGKDDLLKLYKEYDPHTLIPIHGESYFLREHANYFAGLFPDKEVIYMTNHQSLLIRQNGQMKLSEGNKFDPIIIHGDSLPIERSAISARRKIAVAGAVFISKHKSKVEVTVTGLPEVANEITSELIDHIKQFSDDSEGAEQMRIFARRFYASKLGYRPVVFVHCL
jgi:ribonuclease J